MIMQDPLVVREDSGERYLDVTELPLYKAVNLIVKNPEVGFADAETERKIFSTRKPIVVLLQHNDLFSWVSETPALHEHLVRMQAKYNRKIYPFILFHLSVGKTPIIRDIAKFYVANAVHLTSYKDVIDVLSDQESGAYIGTSPEGVNCNFEFDEPVADFSTFGLIKAALQTGATITVVTAKQEKPLSVSIPVPGLKLVKPGAKGIKIPFYRRAGLKLVYEIYEPGITPDQYNAMTKVEQKNVLMAVARDCRKMMIERYSKM